MKWLIFCLVFFTVFVLNISALIKCLDENNNAIDWFMAYKLPKVKSNQKLIKNGLAYAFITSRNYTNWTLSEKSINDSDSLIGHTLNPLYNQYVLRLLYNDETPSGKENIDKGHSKGVILSDNSSGLWLIHSVPRFPPSSPNYSYPSTGVEYGQSFLCLSLNFTNLDLVGLQLQYNTPQIYDQFIPPSLIGKLPNLEQAARNVTVKNAPWFRMAPISTIGNNKFVSFAKAKKFGKDLYEDLIAPSLETDLLVETWVKGTGRLPSNCTMPFKVLNVETVQIKAADLVFNTTHDHSKWAVSQVNDGKNWICIGDINRMVKLKKLINLDQIFHDVYRLILIVIGSFLFVRVKKTDFSNPKGTVEAARFALITKSSPTSTKKLLQGYKLVQKQIIKQFINNYLHDFYK